MDDNEVGSLEFSAPNKEKFDVGYKSLVDNYKIYLDNVSKSIASLSLMLGWLVLSKETRQFFHDHLFARRSFTLILAGLFILYALALYDN